MIKENHISDILFTISDIFERVSEKIEEIDPGYSITLSSLVSEFSHKYGMPKARMYNLIKCLLDTYPGIEIMSGYGIVKLSEDQILSNTTNEVDVIEEVEPPYADQLPPLKSGGLLLA
jgi:hypothetical protein